jgi:hypothetical protein
VCQGEGAVPNLLDIKAFCQSFTFSLTGAI